jgi:hypothetical protein
MSKSRDGEILVVSILKNQQKYEFSVSEKKRQTSNPAQNGAAEILRHWQRIDLN